ncbi:MAG TPA: MFS transporter, partial [Pseudomonadota bacterium]|nr:MFS transporter [Pseudomonadota bacterium]
MLSSSSRRFRYVMLFLLAMTEVMPLALVSQAIPVLMRRGGATMAQIGVVFLAMFPWTLKAVWAPLVDRLSVLPRLGRYRGWLLVTHPLLLAIVLAGSLVDLPGLVRTHQPLALAGLLCLTSVCAVADAAAHGMAVQLLRPDERGLGNTMQTVGLMTGNLIGGGLMVMLTGALGWSMAVLVLAAAVALTLPAIALYREPERTLPRALSMKDVLEFFRQPRKTRWLIVVALLPLGASLIGPSLELLLVDRGFRLREIGLVLGVFSSVAGIVGGVLGGLGVKLLGRQRAFSVLMLFCAAMLTLVLLSGVTSSRWALFIVVSLPNVGVMARATMLHVLMMDRCRGHVASTDFTLQYTVQQVSRFA